jgi:hypothetical protein
MRYLAARNPRHSPPITLVPMRSKYDCMTCVSAMLLGIEYEEVEQAFGGNLDPSKTRDDSLLKEESGRIWRGFFALMEKYHRGMIEFAQMPIVEGRRYYVEIRVHDPGNPLSEKIGHSIVIDEFRKVFDPNPEYGEFKSLKEWKAAVSLPYELRCAKEIFEYSL